MKDQKLSAWPAWSKFGPEIAVSTYIMHPDILQVVSQISLIPYVV